jgi:hypothetical protein
MTPEQEDAKHYPIAVFRGEQVCAADTGLTPWPCPWEQRRRQLEAALKVVEAVAEYDRVKFMAADWDDAHAMMMAAFYKYDDWKSQQEKAD